MSKGSSLLKFGTDFCYGNAGLTNKHKMYREFRLHVTLKDLGIITPIISIRMKTKTIFTMTNYKLIRIK